VELSSQLNFPAEFDQVDTPEASLVQLELGDQHPVSHWVYALVAPYPTITDQVSLHDIKQSWKGNPSGPFAGQPLFMDERTYGVFSAWWGEPVPQAAKIVSTDKMLKRAWDQQPSWGILPFESLEPGWKVLAIDGQSPLRKGFDASNYALTLPGR
jgi:poly-gamma-glutamate synthesis protein (capsule biosynthesis protein)